MAVTKSTTPTALGGTLVVDFDADASIENNVTAATSGSIYIVDIDNSANASTAAYLRIVDAASAVNVAVTHTWLFYVPAGHRTSYMMDDGLAYSAGVTMWCTTNPAAGNGDAPANPVVVRLVVS